MRPRPQATKLSNQPSRSVMKRRARELRALGEAKSAAFRRTQLGSTLRVLTLQPDEDPAADSTPAISSNYLRVRVPGKRPANNWLDVRVLNEEGNFLLSQPVIPPVAPSFQLHPAS